MISASRQNSEGPAEPQPLAADDHIAPVPRISVQAFCETEQTSAAVQAASQDRRLGKAHITIKMGGMARAIETYHSQPTPNVIVLESKAGTSTPSANAAGSSRVFSAIVASARVCARTKSGHSKRSSGG